MIQYSVVLTDDKKPISVDEAEPHRAYHCLDPDCHAPMYRRGGKQVQAHFYHYGEGCKGEIKSIVHYETAALILDIFQHMIESGQTSFIHMYNCPQTDRYYDGVAVIPHIRGKYYYLRNVKDPKINYDFLQGIDNVKWEHSFEGGKYRPDVSLCSGDQLKIPIEVYYSHDDTDEKKQWYRDNELDVIKVDVSGSVYTPEVLKNMRVYWDKTRDAQKIFDILRATIYINKREVFCHTKPYITKIESLHKNIIDIKQAIEDRILQAELAEQQRCEFWRRYALREQELEKKKQETDKKKQEAEAKKKRQEEEKRLRALGDEEYYKLWFDKTSDTRTYIDEKMVNNTFLRDEYIITALYSANVIASTTMEYYRARIDKYTYQYEDFLLKSSKGIKKEIFEKSIMRKIITEVYNMMNVDNGYFLNVPKIKTHDRDFVLYTGVLLDLEKYNTHKIVIRKPDREDQALNADIINHLHDRQALNGYERDKYNEILKLYNGGGIYANDYRILVNINKKISKWIDDNNYEGQEITIPS